MAQRLQELSAELWHLAAFGADPVASPELTGAGSEDFGRFHTVIEAAQRIFDLDPSEYMTDVRTLARWKMQHDRRLAVGGMPTTSDIQHLGKPYRLLIKGAHQLEMLRCKLEANRALKLGEPREAFAALSSLLQMCTLDPQLRGPLGRDEIQTASTLLLRSSQSEGLVRGMLTSILVKQLRQGPTDLKLVAALAKQTALLYRGVKQDRVAAGLEALGQICSQKSPSPKDISEMVARLNPQGLTRF